MPKITMTQEQMFHQAHRRNNDTLQQAYWMAGKMPDEHGRWNNNPLTRDEMEKMAQSDRSYAWAFQMILEGQKAA